MAARASPAAVEVWGSWRWAALRHFGYVAVVVVLLLAGEGVAFGVDLASDEPLLSACSSLRVIEEAQRVTCTILDHCRYAPNVCTKLNYCGLRRCCRDDRLLKADVLRECWLGRI